MLARYDRNVLDGGARAVLARYVKFVVQEFYYQIHMRADVVVQSSPSPGGDHHPLVVSVDGSRVTSSTASLLAHTKHNGKDDRASSNFRKNEVMAVYAQHGSGGNVPQAASFR